jgi:hypothetical protein
MSVISAILVTPIFLHKGPTILTVSSTGFTLEEILDVHFFLLVKPSGSRSTIMIVPKFLSILRTPHQQYIYNVDTDRAVTWILNRRTLRSLAKFCLKQLVNLTSEIC